MLRTSLLLLLFLLFRAGHAQENVQQWGMFELTLPGPQTGNPFVNLQLKGTFTNGTRTYAPEGFYDGEGRYKIRFMPDAPGVWTYETSSNIAALHGRKGQFTCTAPGPDNHGPVRVHNQYYFAYADSTAFHPFGTTLYEWAFQPQAKQQQTLQTLKAMPFNKVRMLAVPPHSARYMGENPLTVFPFEGTAKENFDFSRFNPVYFQQLEEKVAQLRDLGIEAEIILFRPYDKGKWGFDMMDAATNDRFLRYMMARFAAYRNVWWSLSNENSFIKHLSDEDWDHLFQVVAAHDPYGHLRSIHNADRLYDYRKPWVTHVSLQYYNAVKAFGVSPLLRDVYRKPIVHDEINYEGNSARRWGQLTGEELTYRFWVACIGGAYATHGETKGPEGWIGVGGTLTGTSPARIGFLRQIVEAAPKEGLKPLDQYYLTNVAGKYGAYYLIYFGKDKMKEWDFVLPDDELKDGMRFRVEVIDTWNMKISPIAEPFEVKKLSNYQFIEKNNRKVKLPNKPYLALRIQLIGDQQAQGPGKNIKRNELTDEEQ
jgi:hypothetical protein